MKEALDAGDVWAINRCLALLSPRNRAKPAALWTPAGEAPVRVEVRPQRWA